MDFSGLFNLMKIMVVMTVIGVVLNKMHIITDKGRKILTELLLNIFLPCNIVKAFYIEFNSEILFSGLTILIVSSILQMVCTFISANLYNWVPQRQRMILQYGTVCSNAGFLGNPVAEGIYGSLGLLYASIYLIPQRIVMWSAGISYFTESPDRKTIIKTVLKHPCIIAVEIGLFILLFQIPLPESVVFLISKAGGLSTSLSMIVIGTILAGVDFRSIITKLTLFFSFLRLFVIPLLVLMGCLIFRVNSLITGVSVVLAAMPAGSTTAILAAKYNGDAEFATKCVVLTTILSMIMIPIWCLILIQL